MRHKVNKRTFGRRPEARKALLRGLATSLVENERITTTVVRAKELRKVVEPLVTLAKKGDLHSRRQVAAYLYKNDAVKKLFSELAERFRTRPGGYTRIYRKGFRRGDGAETVIIEFLPSETGAAKKEKPKKVVAKKEPKAAKEPKKTVEAKEPKAKKVVKAKAKKE